MPRHKRSSLPLALAVALFLLVAPFAHAQTIKVVKAKAVVIEGIEAKAGDLYYAIDDQGKRRAIIEITKAKGSRAAGKIKRGKAKVGMTLQPRGAGPAAKSESSTETQFREGEAPKESKLAIGGMLGFGMDTISVGYTTETVETKGSGFSLKGVGDYKFGELLGLRALAGYETVNATG
ncbi:MAG TPA: hypothetical protein VFV50_09370, partial [Bdellovibrionales bacterium]|nr:hypothetical protein [Bdellovibrionales bacterium]